MTNQLLDALAHSRALPIFLQSIAQIVCALRYLHSLGVIHRDIKPENGTLGCQSKVMETLLSTFVLTSVLIGADGAMKLADFGWAVHDRNPRQVKDAMQVYKLGFC